MVVGVVASERMGGCEVAASIYNGQNEERYVCALTALQMTMLAVASQHREKGSL